ncbi:MAG: TetR/AcrR family transcriptional regulator [SAR324 cluster bacterium]|nr:TetR/AcrR family transcriptional regulator [SAR324 cluster bacterium]
MPKPTEETRLQILEAAQNRFMQYGFQKTNVNEIAADCDMSPANLYRFFESKGDMGAAVIKRHIENTKRLKAQTAEMSGSAQEKLIFFCHKTIEYNFNIFSNQIHLFELMEFISKKRKELPTEHVALKQACIKEVIEVGQATGEIGMGDPEQLAMLIFQALRGFLLPHTLIPSGVPLEKLKLQSKKLIQLLFSGL